MMEGAHRASSNFYLGRSWGPALHFDDINSLSIHSGHIFGLSVKCWCCCYFGGFLKLMFVMLHDVYAGDYAYAVDDAYAVYADYAV